MNEKLLIKIANILDHHGIKVEPLEIHSYARDLREPDQFSHYREVVLSSPNGYLENHQNVAFYLKGLLEDFGAHRDYSFHRFHWTITSGDWVYSISEGDSDEEFLTNFCNHNFHEKLSEARKEK